MPLIKLLFGVIFLFAIRYVLSRLFGKRQVRNPRPKGSTEPRRAVSGRMVKDPLCGTYVATELAVPCKSEGKLLHFCSQECLDEYVSAVALRRTAATSNSTS